MPKVLFLQRDGYEIFGVKYLSAVLISRGYKTDVLIEYEEGKDFYKKIMEIRPDVVAFSIMTGLHTWSTETARRVKQVINCHIIAGGPHCTFFPEFIEEDGIDAICRSEAEDSLPLYLDNLFSGNETYKIPDWWVKTHGVIYKNDIHPLRQNLDEIPYPDREIYRKRYPNLEGVSQLNVLVARGCPYACTFCYNQYMKEIYRDKGNYVRRHSVQRVIDEIKYNLNQVGKKLRWVQFVDDLFIMDRKWSKTFLVEYNNKIRIPFGCSVRANLVDEELVLMLSNAGCKVVSFGIESGDEELRNKVLNKNVKDDMIIRTASILQKYNIRFSAFNMFNLPGETVEKAKKTIFLNQKIRKGNYPWSGLLQPYRGTEIYDYSQSLGFLQQDDIIANFFHSPTIKQPDTKALEQINAYFYWMVRYPILQPVFNFLVEHPISLLTILSRLSSSFHRNVMLLYPLEGASVIRNTFLTGLKRLRAYL